MSFSTAVTLVMGTISLAAVYSLVNLGVVVLYRTTGVINFAQGHFMLVGALVTTSLAGALTYWPRLLVAALAVAAVGAVVYTGLMRFLLGAEEFPKVITTLMLSVVITAVVSTTWGVKPRTLGAPSRAVVHVGSAVVEVSDLISAGVGVALVALTILLMHRTVVGARMRALASNEPLAVFSGMRVHMLGAIGWGLTGAAAAVAGVVYAQRAGVGIELPLIGLGAFPAVVIGGMDSVGGVLPAGLLVAAVQTVAVYYFGAVWGDIVLWSGMVATLLFLPRGLFGTKQLRRL